MKNIGVDIDEVLADTYNYFLREINYNLGNNPLSWDNLIEYNFWDLPGFTLNKEETMKIWYNIMTEKIINVPVIDGSYDKLKSYKDLGYNFYAVTGRALDVEKHTYDWLERYFPGIFKNVYFSNNGLKNEIKKSQLIKDLKIDFFIDDNIKFVEDIYFQTNAKVFLFNKPWNKNKKLKYPDIQRVDSWDEIIL